MINKATVIAFECPPSKTDIFFAFNLKDKLPIINNIFPREIFDLGVVYVYTFNETAKRFGTVNEI